MFSRSLAGSISAPSSSAIAPPYGPFEEADGGWPIAEETGRRIGPTSALIFRKRRCSLLLRRRRMGPRERGRMVACHASGPDAFEGLAAEILRAARQRTALHAWRSLLVGRLTRLQRRRAFWEDRCGSELTRGPATVVGPFGAQRGARGCRGSVIQSNKALIVRIAGWFFSRCWSAPCSFRRLRVR